VLDAEHGWLDVDPPAADEASIERMVAQREQERVADAAAASTEARTRDGVRVASTRTWARSTRRRPR
jgi:phosphoenolpyruvate-protein kinase (PTS system EI component)